MRRIQNDSAAQLAARGIALAIVLPGTPVGQVLRHLSARPQNTASNAFFNESLERLYAGVEAQIISNLHHTIKFGRFIFECAYAIKTIAERLFDEDIGAAAQGAQRMLHMTDGRCANEDYVRLESAERFIEVCEGLNG